MGGGGLSDTGEVVFHDFMSGQVRYCQAAIFATPLQLDGYCFIGIQIHALLCCSQIPLDYVLPIDFHTRALLSEKTEMIQYGHLHVHCKSVWSDFHK